jgi:hypothetical protein
MYTNDTPETLGVSLTLFADDTCMYALDHKESYVLRKLQHSHYSTSIWYQLWNIKISEDETWAMFFSYRHRLPEVHHTLNRWNNPFMNRVKYSYFSVIFSRRIAWRLHTEMVCGNQPHMLSQC